MGNLVWYLAVFSAVLAASRSLTPHGNRKFDPVSAMEKVTKHTHFLPSEWRGGGSASYRTRSQFLELFQFKLVLFFNDLIGVFLTPFILAFWLPTRANKIVEFIRDYTTFVDGLGAVCVFSLFDMRYSQGGWGGSKSVPPSMRATDGKLMKSLLSFKKENPAWEPGDAGTTALSEVSDFAASIGADFMTEEADDDFGVMAHFCREHGGDNAMSRGV